MTNEFFPPTEQELEQMIKTLEAQLEDDKHEENWIKIHDELLILRRQLQQLTIENNAL